MTRFLKVILLGLFLLLNSKVGLTAGAHVHGQAYLSIALDGQNLVVHLSSAAHDVVGFEQLSGHQDEQAQIAAVTDSLKSADDWLIFAGGDCVSQSVEVVSPFVTAHTDHSDHSHDSDHSHHSDHSESGGHADFEVTAEYLCQSPADLSGLSIRLTELFSEIQQIEVQWLVHDQQGLLNLSFGDNEVRFR